MSDVRAPTRLHLAQVSSTTERAREEAAPTPLPQRATGGGGSDRRAHDRRSHVELRRTRSRHIISLVISVLWLAALGGYVWGYFGAAPPSMSTWALIAGAAFIPIVLVVMLVELSSQARGLARATYAISRLASRMTEPEDRASDRIATVGTAIRKQLDLLSTALDSTLDRVAAIESMVENQVGAVERVGGRAQMRAQMIRDLLQDERNALNAIAEDLNTSAGSIVEVVSKRLAEVREVNEKSTADLREAEGAFALRTEKLARVAEDTARITTAKATQVEEAAKRLEDVSSQSVAAAQTLTDQIGQQQLMLRQAADRLESESVRLNALFANEGDLIARMETAAAGLPDRLRPVLEGVAGELDGALARVETRATDAAQALKTEAALAARVGEEAARAIVAAASSSREAAEAMRAAVVSEIATLGQTLDERVSGLDGVTAGMSRALQGANLSATTLTTSLDGAMKSLEGATRRLLDIVQTIGTETDAARGTLDAAAEAVERKFARVPELAAEQAARLSSLLGDQASRMGALAQSLATTSLPNATPKLAEAEAPAALPAPPPAARPAQTPSALARAAQPSLSVPPAQPPAPLPAASFPAASLPAAPPLISHADTQLDELDAMEAPEGRFSLARIGRFLGRGGRREDPAPPSRLNDGEAVDINHGFWTTLFARIEGDEHPVIALPPEPLHGSAGTSETDTGLTGSRVRNGLEGLHAIAIDLDRLLEEAPPVDLWKRYRDGERDVFARRLVGQKGDGLEPRIRQKYGEESEFRDHADRYVTRFEELLRDVAEDADRVALQSTAAGRLNVILVNALASLR